MKKTTGSQHICCYECVSCPENHYSNQTGNTATTVSQTPGLFLLNWFFSVHNLYFFIWKNKKASHDPID
jgi:hypothetical protein